MLTKPNFLGWESYSVFPPAPSCDASLRSPTFASLRSPTNSVLSWSQNLDETQKYFFV